MVTMVKIKDIPILKGKVAERFIKISEENLRNKGSIDFSKEYKNSMLILKKKR